MLKLALRRRFIAKCCDQITIAILLICTQSHIPGVITSPSYAQRVICAHNACLPQQQADFNLILPHLHLHPQDMTEGTFMRWLEDQ